MPAGTSYRRGRRGACLRRPTHCHCSERPRNCRAIRPHTIPRHAQHVVQAPGVRDFLAMGWVPARVWLYCFSGQSELSYPPSYSAPLFSPYQAILSSSGPLLSPSIVSGPVFGSRLDQVAREEHEISGAGDRTDLLEGLTEFVVQAGPEPVLIVHPHCRDERADLFRMRRNGRWSSK